jgi:hypothetical protein
LALGSHDLPPGSETEELLTRWQKTIAQFEERLLLLARRPVDVRNPEWPTKLRRVRPLDEAGIRVDVEALLEDIVSHYASLDEQARECIRDLFRQNQSFTWAAGFGYPPTSEVSLRKHLTLVSIQDQGRDPRDAGALLYSICRAAYTAGVDPRPLLLEVAASSSATDRWHWGSTRQQMLAEARRWRWRFSFW